jgi:membrane protease YdiL (CAAX protease family)
MTIRTFSLEHPIATALTLILIAGVFRLLDIFLLRLDERWGEIIVSKSIGVGLLLAFLLLAGAPPAAAGFSSRAVLPSVLLGAGLTVAALLLGYAAEVLHHAHRGECPVIQIAAIDPKSGLTGAVPFAVLLIVGNLVNSLAEEGLFRGVQIPLFRRELSPWFTLALSATLFGLWHLPWALKTIALGSQGPSANVTMPLVANFLPQALLGVVWGYLYLHTGNLWGCVAAHTLTNSAVNFLHVRSSEGIDTAMPLRMTIFTITMLLGMVAIWYLAKRLQLPTVQPWGSGPA